MSDIADRDELAPALRGVDLTYVTAPDWLREQWVANQRFGRVADVDRLLRISWHAFYRSALDYAAMTAGEVGIMRVLVDWHGDGVSAIEPRSSEVARRAKCTAGYVRHALADLAAAGWVTPREQPGRPSQLTLLVPWELSPTRALTAHLARPTRAHRTHPPARSARGGARTEHTPARTEHTTGERGKGASSGAGVNPSRDVTQEALPAAVDDRCADPWDGFYTEAEE